MSEQLIYGVFNTPVNSIGGSAICAFSLRSIIATFNGPFKEQENMNSNWLPVAKSKVSIFYTRSFFGTRKRDNVDGCALFIFVFPFSLHCISFAILASTSV